MESICKSPSPNKDGNRSKLNLTEIMSMMGNAIDDTDNNLEDGTLITPSKKKDSSFLKSKDIPKEYMDFFAASGIDDKLEEKAQKVHMTAAHVKKVIRDFLTNKDVVEMFRDEMTDDEKNSTRKQRWTRSKVKEFLKDHENIKGAPLLAKDAHPPASPETVWLVTNEFPEEEEDEDYDPSKDAHDGSDEESISSFGTPLSCRNPQTIVTPKSVGTPSSIQTYNLLPNITTVQRNLNFTSANQLDGPCTRSKKSFTDTNLEDLENAFNPFDATPDLYELRDDCPIWTEFLNDFQQPINRTGIQEDEDDPDYTFCLEEETPNKDDLKWEFRGDRGVKISKNEYRSLMVEFVDSFMVDSEDNSRDNQERNRMRDELFQKIQQPFEVEEDVNCSLNQSNCTLPAAYCPSPQVDCNFIQHKIDQTPQIISCVALRTFPVSYEAVLKNQLMQHVQLLATNATILRHSTDTLLISQHCREMLIKLDERISNRAVSYYPWNLKPALDMINQHDLVYDINMDYPIDRTTCLNMFPSDIVKVFLESSALPFAKLIPTSFFKTKNVNAKKKFLYSEDMLLALRLETLAENDKEKYLNIIKKVHYEGILSKELNKQGILIYHLKGIENHLKYIKNSYLPKNPVAIFLKNLKDGNPCAPVPPLTLEKELPSMPCPLATVPPNALPYPWKQMVQHHQTKDVGSVIILNNIPLNSKVLLPSSKHSSPLVIPSVQQPPMAVPSVQQPQMAIPSVQQPRMVVPPVQRLQMAIPSIQQPQMAFPSVQQPQMAFPSVQQPQMVVPSVQQPQLAVPSVQQLQMVVPSIQQPQLAVPSVQQPQMVVPTVQRSSFTIPSIQNASPLFIQSSQTSASFPSTSTHQQSLFIPSSQQSSPFIITSTQQPSTLYNPAINQQSPLIFPSIQSSPLAFSPNRQSSPLVLSIPQSNPSGKGLSIQTSKPSLKLPIPRLKNGKSGRKQSSNTPIKRISTKKESSHNIKSSSHNFDEMQSQPEQMILDDPEYIISDEIDPPVTKMEIASELRENTHETVKCANGVICNGDPAIRNDNFNECIKPEISLSYLLNSPSKILKKIYTTPYKGDPLNSLVSLIGTPQIDESYPSPSTLQNSLDTPVMPSVASYPNTPKGFSSYSGNSSMEKHETNGNLEDVKLYHCSLTPGSSRSPSPTDEMATDSPEPTVNAPNPIPEEENGCQTPSLNDNFPQITELTPTNSPTEIVRVDESHLSPLGKSVDNVMHSPLYSPPIDIEQTDGPINLKSERSPAHKKTPGISTPDGRKCEIVVCRICIPGEDDSQLITESTNFKKDHESQPSTFTVSSASNLEFPQNTEGAVSSTQRDKSSTSGEPPSPRPSSANKNTSFPCPIKFRPIQKSPYKAPPSMTSPILKKQKISPKKVMKTRLPFILPKRQVLRAKPAENTITSTTESISSQSYRSPVDEKSEMELTNELRDQIDDRCSDKTEDKSSNLQVDDDEEEIDIMDDDFEMEDEDELDQQKQQKEEHLAALVKASSTIHSNRGRRKMATSSTKGSQKMNKQQKTLQARIDAIGRAPDSDAQEKALSFNFLTRVRDALLPNEKPRFNEFVSLLRKFEAEPYSPEVLYFELKILFKDYPELSEEFVNFLMPQQALHVGKFAEYCMVQRFIEFVEKVQHQFGKKTSVLRKIICLVQTELKKPDLDFEGLRSAISPIIRYPHLIESFMQCFPSQPPTQSLTDDFEDINIDEAGSPDSAENINLIDDHSPDHCTCSCHSNLNQSANQSASASSQIKTDHCNLCALRFIDGRVYLQHGKSLKPARITYFKEEEDTASSTQGATSGVDPAHPNLQEAALNDHPSDQDEQSLISSRDKKGSKDVRSTKSSHTKVAGFKPKTKRKRSSENKEDNNLDVTHEAAGNENNPKSADAPGSSDAVESSSISINDLPMMDGWSREDDRLLLSYLKNPSVSLIELSQLFPDHSQDIIIRRLTTIHELNKS